MKPLCGIQKYYYYIYHDLILKLLYFIRQVSFWQERLPAERDTLPGGRERLLVKFSMLLNGLATCEFDERN